MLQDADAALEDLAQNRAAEGQALGEVFHAILTEIADRVRLAGETAGAQAAVLRDRLKIKLDALIAEGIAEDRLAQEAAVLAVKADVREELDRLSAHITSARALLAGEGPVGRKLDFLAQEFNREANTLCAKSADPALTEQGLALKALVDQFREQAQNVE
ncbi:MAG: endoribonuclease YicC domain-containing protein [Maricaulaceae bacterium]